MHPLPSRLSFGFNLLELLMVLAVLSLLIGLGVHGLSDYIDRVRLDAAADKLMAHLAMARSYAIHRGRWVTIVPISQGWGQGWQVFEDLNRNAQKDRDEHVLAEQQDALKVQIESRGPTQRYVSFNPDGRPLQSNGALLAGTWLLCNAHGRRVALVMSASGRVRMDRNPTATCGN